MRADRLAGVGGDGGQEDLEVPGHPLRRRGVEQCRVVADGDGEGWSGGGDDGERVVGLLAGVQVAQSQAVGCGGVVVDGVVLEDDDAVEQAGAVGYGGPCLDLGQRGRVVLAGLGLGVLEGLQPCGDGAGVVDLGADGQGVDEDPGDVAGAGEVGGAAGDGGAEDDVVVSGVAGEQQCPGALEQCVEGEAVRLGELLEAG